MDEIGLPPKSLRRNAPLKHRQAEMPKWFPNDDKYVVKDFDEEQIPANRNQHIIIERQHQKLIPLVGSR